MHIETACAPSLEGPSHVIAISETKNQQKVDNFKPVYLGNQRWCPRGRPWPRGRPRGHILKSLASKVKSLASRLQVLENWPVLGSKTALLNVFFGDRLKIFCEDLFFREHLRLCPWSLASSIPVLGLESVCPRKGCPWPRIFFVSLALASSLVS